MLRKSDKLPCETYRAFVEARPGVRLKCKLQTTRVAESDDDGNVTRMKLVQLEDRDGTIPYRATLSMKRRTCLLPSSTVYVFLSLSSSRFHLCTEPSNDDGTDQRKEDISESGHRRERGVRLSLCIVYTHCPTVWKVDRRRCGLPIKLDLLRVRSIGSTAAVQIHGNHEISRAHNPVSFLQTDCCYIFRENADRRYAPDTLHNIGTVRRCLDAICWTARYTRNNRYREEWLVI